METPFESDHVDRPTSLDQNQASYREGGTKLSNNDQKPPFFDPNLQAKNGSISTSAVDAVRPKSKTSLRMKYEAEVRVIQRQLGSLEEVRESLGISRRKMCQLLMVDPSAWTRWMKDESRVPPHIWRGLQWYMALIDKKPEWHPQNSFGQAPMARLEAESQEISQMKEEIERKVSEVSFLPEKLEARLRAQVDDLQTENKELIRQVQQQAQVGVAWKFMVLLNLLVLGFWMVAQIL